MNSENKLVIEQINKFGKVPQRYELLQMIERLEQENKKLSENYDRIYNENCNLEDNWNKLKGYLHNVDVVVDYSENYDGHFINYDVLMDKMQEIEQGSGINDSN